MYMNELQLNTHQPNQAMKKNRVVLFVGDGTNDATAVAQADVGVHIASVNLNASDTIADVVLLGGSKGCSCLVRYIPTRREPDTFQLHLVSCVKFVYDLTGWGAVRRDKDSACL